MTPEEYRQQRLDPRWQMKRLKIMERDHARCCDCDRSKQTLNVHHQYYVKGRKPWEYPNFALITLCWECHEERHKTPCCLATAELGNNSFEAWEREAEMLFGGDTKEVFRFFDVARMIQQAANAGAPRESIYDRICEFIRDNFTLLK